MRLQLLAIVREGDRYKALIYDPDTDKLLAVAEGESLGARLIERVTPLGVEVRDEVGIRALALRPDAQRVE